MRPTVVVAPGAFVTDAEFWYRPLAELLEPHNIPLKAVDLPSCGNAPPLGDLFDDAAAMREAVLECEGPVILGGHSYSGLVITEASAGLSHKVKHLLYISGITGDKCIMESDYIVPGEAPQTDIEIRVAGRRMPLPKAVQSASNAGQGPWNRFCYWLGKRSLQLPGIEGTLGEGPGAKAFKSNELRRLENKALIEEGLKRVTRQSMSSFLQGPKHLGINEIPSTFFHGLNDGEVPWGQLRAQGSRCTKVVEVPTNHFCHLDRPELVAEVIVKIADEIDASDESREVEKVVG